MIRVQRLHTRKSVARKLLRMCENSCRTRPGLARRILHFVARGGRRAALRCHPAAVKTVARSRYRTRCRNHRALRHWRKLVALLFASRKVVTAFARWGELLIEY